MKIRLILPAIFFILLLTYSVIGQAQSLENLEIWGWEKSKADFHRVYMDSVQTDLYTGYTCEVDLKKLGYDFSISTVFIEDIESFKNNTLNWDSTERLAIIRQIPENALLRESGQPEFQAALNSLLQRAGDDQVSFSQDEMLLLFRGMYTPVDQTRTACEELLNKAFDAGQRIEATQESEVIMAQLMSFPDPAVVYVAMNYSSEFPQRSNEVLFAEGAITLMDFLNSDLQNFRNDAMAYLNIRFETDEEMTAGEYIELVSKYSN